MEPHELRESAEHLLEKLSQSFPLKRKPSLVWKGALRVSAGMAYYQTWQIGLSPHLLTDSERLEVTLVHEYAHLMAYERHGKKGAGHGPAWRAAMEELGQEPEVRHRYQVQRNRKRQTVSYICRKCGQRFERHKRLPRRRHYLHVGCGGAIALSAVHTSAS